MTQPGPGNPNGGGGGSGAPGSGGMSVATSRPVTPPPPPPNPHVESLNIAIQLASIRSVGVPVERTDVELLISDAAKIAEFIGKGLPKRNPPI